MPETAESHAVTLTTNRNCTMEINNISSVYCLVNPKVYMESGFPFSPPQPTVRTANTELCSFTKPDNAARGTAGVLTYDLFDMQRRQCKELVAVMFSVPFDYNFYKNWLGVGVFDRTQACDKTLFELMYEGKDFTNFVRHEANGSGLKFAGRTTDVRACMSDEGRAIVKLELYDKMG